MSIDEFADLIGAKTNIGNKKVIRRDIILHAILREIYEDDELKTKLLFKGGTCLVKCYYGYYRFSDDLDFTWNEPRNFKKKSKSEIRRIILNELLPPVVGKLEIISKKFDLNFKPQLSSREYFDFRRKSRQITIKMYDKGELIKIEINFIDILFYKPVVKKAITLLNNAKISKSDTVYFEDFFQFYEPINVLAYDIHEIAIEKIRSILTRDLPKFRDYYDLFKMYMKGVFDLKDQILINHSKKKIKFMLKESKRYIANLRNARLKTPEKEMILNEGLSPDFYTFAEKLNIKLKEIREEILKSV